jgi:hypothetical protein
LYSDLTVHARNEGVVSGMDGQAKQSRPVVASTGSRVLTWAYENTQVLGFAVISLVVSLVSAMAAANTLSPALGGIEGAVQTWISWQFVAVPHPTADESVRVIEAIQPTVVGILFVLFAIPAWKLSRLAFSAIHGRPWKLIPYRRLGADDAESMAAGGDGR